MNDARTVGLDINAEICFDPCRAAEWESYENSYEAWFMVTVKEGRGYWGWLLEGGNGADNDLQSALGLWTTKRNSGSAVVAIFCE